MMRNIVVIFAFLLFSSPMFVSAQTQVTTETIRPYGVREPEAVREAVQTRLETVRQAREKVAERVETRRTQVETQAAERREQFQEKLSELSDERKKNALENIDNMLQSRNERWTTHANAVLSRLSQILVKISTRADMYKSENGTDVTAVMNAVLEAQTALDTAQASVTEQAGKVYTIDIETEESIGENTRVVVQELKTDVEAMMELVRNARTEVQQAFRALQLLNIENEE